MFGRRIKVVGNCYKCRQLAESAGVVVPDNSVEFNLGNFCDLRRQSWNSRSALAGTVIAARPRFAEAVTDGSDKFLCEAAPSPTTFCTVEASRSAKSRQPCSSISWKTASSKRAVIAEQNSRYRRGTRLPDSGQQRRKPLMRSVSVAPGHSFYQKRPRFGGDRGRHFKRLAGGRTDRA